MAFNELTKQIAARPGLLPFAERSVGLVLQFYTYIYIYIYLVGFKGNLFHYCRMFFFFVCVCVFLLLLSGGEQKQLKLFCLFLFVGRGKNRVTLGW